MKDKYFSLLINFALNFRSFKGDSMMSKARSFGDRELYRKAQNINLPSCDNLQKYLDT